MDKLRRVLDVNVAGLAATFAATGAPARTRGHGAPAGIAGGRRRGRQPRRVQRFKAAAIARQSLRASSLAVA